MYNSVHDSIPISLLKTAEFFKYHIMILIDVTQFGWIGDWLSQIHIFLFSINLLFWPGMSFPNEVSSDQITCLQLHKIFWHLCINLWASVSWSQHSPFNICIDMRQSPWELTKYFLLLWYLTMVTIVRTSLTEGIIPSTSSCCDWTTRMFYYLTELYINWGFLYLKFLGVCSGLTQLSDLSVDNVVIFLQNAHNGHSRARCKISFVSSSTFHMLCAILHEFMQCALK